MSPLYNVLHSNVAVAWCCADPLVWFANTPPTVSIATVPILQLCEFLLLWLEQLSPQLPLEPSSTNMFPLSIIVSVLVTFVICRAIKRVVNYFTNNYESSESNDSPWRR